MQSVVSVTCALKSFSGLYEKKQKNCEGLCKKEFGKRVGKATRGLVVSLISLRHGSLRSKEVNDQTNSQKYAFDRM